MVFIYLALPDLQQLFVEFRQGVNNVAVRLFHLNVLPYLLELSLAAQSTVASKHDSLTCLCCVSLSAEWPRCCWSSTRSLDVVTREIKLFWNNSEIISVLYFTRNHIWNWNNIVSVTEGVLKLFSNYSSDSEHVGKYSWAAISLWNNFELISGKFPCAEIKLFQMEVDKGWNN